MRFVFCRMNRLFHLAVTHDNVLIRQDKSLLVIKSALMPYDRINILIMSVSSFNWMYLHRALLIQLAARLDRSL